VLLTDLSQFIASLLITEIGHNAITLTA